jgi:arylsulfatase A-like enzyme
MSKRALLHIAVLIVIIVLVEALLARSADARGETPPVLDRTRLPIAEPAAPAISEIDPHKVAAPERFEVRPPKGAPNVVIVLIDDMGFGHSSAFGGPCDMPTFERLANEGLRFNRFHTTALCSPTRAALLTGRNHHVNNMGSITELATAFPGNTGVRPRNVTPLAEILRLNGYGTAAFGKSHETPAWETTVVGPFDRWPTHSGFDRFYGFLAAETNQWSPSIIDGTVRIDPPAAGSGDAEYHFTTDMTNQAVRWVEAQHALAPGRPFFIYFAPGATHAPHHVPAEWIARYRGRFDQGWDKLREETLARQIAKGIVPKSTKLTPRPKEIAAWDSYGEDERRVMARQMETYAAYASHTDHEIGRLVDAIESMGELDDTLFIYIAGDNGASAEGGPEGSFNEILNLNAVDTTTEMQLSKLDEWGGPSTYPHYAVGWAHAGNTPFQWTKQVASHLGGTRNAMVMCWPARIRPDARVRAQFHHVIDIAPTVLDAAGIPEPTLVNGIEQRPMDGVSMLYAAGDANARDRRTTQYFEMFGNRAIYHDGWTAVARHSIPWVLQAKMPPVADDRWELYDLRSDFSQSNDLAAKEPARLEELKRLFDREAVRNHVYPLDDRRVERLSAEIAGRPDLVGAHASITLFEGMTGIAEGAFLDLRAKSHEIVADIEIPEGGGDGVIIAQAGRFGGWSLYMKGGRVCHVHNFAGLELFTVRSMDAIAPGMHAVRYEFARDEVAAGTGGTSRLYVDGRLVGETHVGRTMPFTYSVDECVDVGCDRATPVTSDYAERDNAFNGRIVQVSVSRAPAAMVGADAAKGHGADAEGP